MVRYADDFVIVSNDTMEGVQQTKQEIKQYLETETTPETVRREDQNHPCQ
jgi:hypothetical protein